MIRKGGTGLRNNVGWMVKYRPARYPRYLMSSRAKWQH